MKYMNKLLQADEKAEDPAVAASTSDDKNYFYMQTEWLEQQIKLLVLDTKTNKCFRGEISNDIMQEVAEQLDLEYTGFMEECKRALTTNIGLPGFTYKIDYEELVFQAFKNDKFETQYLDIPLKVVKNQYELLDIAIETLAEATTMNNNVQTASTASGNSLRGFDPTKFQQDFDKLKELIDNNKQMEVKLIKKFAFLLKQKDDEMERLVKANKELKAKAKKMQGVGGSSAAAADDDDDQAYMDATQPMTPPSTNVDLIHQRTNTRGKRRQVLDSDSDTD